MRVDFTVLLLSLVAASAASAIDPELAARQVEVDVVDRDDNELWKRRGGGGGGGRGGSTGGGGSSSGGGSGRGGSGSGSGSGSGRGTGSSTPGNTRPNSNAGGSSSAGSGPQPSYGGGRYYGGGSRSPYSAGSRGGVPFTAGALAFWPGLWIGGAYLYSYPHHYYYHNDTNDKNESHPVMCGCAQGAVCSCEENNDTMKELVGNGKYANLNTSIINVADVNDTKTFLVNGTLPNGTTVKSDDDAATSLLHTLGYWPAVAVVLATVFIA